VRRIYRLARGAACSVLHMWWQRELHDESA
jgi:hypothetical protein